MEAVSLGRLKFKNLVYAGLVGLLFFVAWFN